MSRQRSRGQLVAGPSVRYEGKYTDCSHMTWYDLAPGQTSKVGSVEYMNDVVQDKFHSAVKSGQVFFNPMWYHKQTNTRSEGTGIHRRSKTSFVCSGSTYFTETRGDRNTVDTAYNAKKGLDTYGYPAPPSLVATSDIDSLVTELSTKVLSNRFRSDTNLWETLAEVDSLFSTLPGLLKAAESLLTSKKGREMAKGGADGFLTFKFGLLPIISDIQGVLKGIDQEVGRKRVTTRSRDSLMSTSSETWNVVSATLVQSYRTTYSDLVEVSAMSLDEYSVSRAFTVGFSSKNLLTLPWELFRMSFVYDYFANVGDLIGSLVPEIGNSNLGGCVVIKRTRVVAGEANGTYGTYPGVTQPSDILIPMTGGFTAVDIEKTRSSTIAAPGFTIRKDFRLSNIQRSATLLALLVQSLASKRN